MTENAVRAHAHEGIAKLTPMIQQVGNVVADAYQLGFDTGLALGEKICRDICVKLGVDPDKYLLVEKENKPANPTSTLLG